MSIPGALPWRVVVYGGYFKVLEDANGVALADEGRPLGMELVVDVVNSYGELSAALRRIAEAKPGELESWECRAIAHEALEKLK